MDLSNPKCDVKQLLDDFIKWKNKSNKDHYDGIYFDSLDVTMWISTNFPADGDRREESLNLITVWYYAGIIDAEPNMRCPIDTRNILNIWFKK